MSKQFSALGIQDGIQKSLVDLKFSEPTDIQTKTIPHILNQK